MLKSAIVGCGAIAPVHAQAIPGAGGELAAAADVRFDRAQALTAAYGGRAFSSMEEMLDEARPDVLHICTPHYLHIPMAAAALRRGIHVLCEKPIGLSAADAAALRPALAAGARFGVCFQNRWNASVKEAREIVASGELGALKSLRGMVTWSRGEAYYRDSGWRGAWATEGGGVLINQSIHTLDLLLLFAGEPEAIGAKVGNHHLPGVIEVEDSAEIYLRFPSGVTGVFYATTALSVDVPILLDLFFERGTLRIEGDTLTMIRSDGEGGAPAVFPHSACWGTGHAALIADFYDCVRTGRAFAVGCDEALRVTRVLDAVYRSDKSGEVVSL